MNPKLIFYNQDELLEGPIYDNKHDLLYFVSILDCLVYCYNPKQKSILSIKLDSPVGCVFLKERLNVVAATKNGFFECNFDKLESRLMFKIQIPNNVRFNDGILAPDGRFIVGTMGYPEVLRDSGKVYSIKNGNSQVIIEKTTISNGLAFDNNYNWLYFIDTPTKTVVRYNYDQKSGKVENMKKVIDFNSKGVPDGMSRDNKGNLWIAEWGGGCVSLWNPESGKKLSEVVLPCENITSCCLDSNGNLYVTSAKSNDNNNNFGGGLFYIELNHK